MGSNMVTNVYVKFNHDRLHIDKALGIFENLTTTTRTTFVALGGGGFPGPKNHTFTSPQIHHQKPELLTLAKLRRNRRRGLGEPLKHLAIVSALHGHITGSALRFSFFCI